MVFRLLKKYVSRAVLFFAAYGNMVMGMNGDDALASTSGGGDGVLSSELHVPPVMSLSPLTEVHEKEARDEETKEELSPVVPEPVRVGQPDVFSLYGERFTSSLSTLCDVIQSLYDVVSLLPADFRGVHSRLEELTSIAKDIRDALKDGMKQERERFEQLAGFIKEQKGAGVPEPPAREEQEDVEVAGEGEQYFDTEEQLEERVVVIPSPVDEDSKLRVLVIREGGCSHFDLTGFIENSINDYKNEMVEFLDAEVAKMKRVILPALEHLQKVKYQQKGSKDKDLEGTDSPGRLRLDKLVSHYKNLVEEYSGELERVNKMDGNKVGEKVQKELLKIMEDMYCAGGVSFDLFCSLVVGLANAEGKRASEEVRLSLYEESGKRRPCIILGDFDKFVKNGRMGPPLGRVGSPLGANSKAQAQFRVRRSMLGGLSDSDRYRREPPKDSCGSPSLGSVSAEVVECVA